MNPFIASALLVAAYAICLLGCALLSFSQTRNWRTVMSDRKAQPPKTSLAGWALVLLSLVPCVVRDDGSFAALLWPLVFAASAMSVAMMLTYKPNWLAGIVRLVPASTLSGQRSSD